MPMKRLLLLPVLFALTLICWKGLNASSTSDRTIQNEVDVSPGQKLFLDLDTGGSIVIRGWDKNSVFVKADMNGREANDCEFQMNKIPGGVRIRSLYKGNSQSYSTEFHFELNVPQNFNVHLNSSGGDIKIVGLNGEMEGSTGGGEIFIEDTKGKVNFSTGGGEINIIRSHVDGDVSTGAGDIHFDDVTGDIDGTTGSGSVIRNGGSKGHVKPASFHEKQGVLLIEKAGGGIYIEDAPNGIHANTGGGEIRVGTAKNVVSVQTGGGDIRIDQADGLVEATTGAGDIHVKMISTSSADHDVDISSGSGDVTLLVPPSFSMDLDLKIGYTKETGAYDIISDFPLNKRTTDKWSAVEGTPRKYIYGTGSFSGGKNRIHVSTVNGSIYLKKG
jgi:hypothetical protein